MKNPEHRASGIANVIVNPAPAWFAPDFDADQVFEFHRKLPGYSRTPLIALPRIAARLKVGRVWVKDESARLGLPAYKVLGAAWATYRGLEQRLGVFDPWSSMHDLARQLEFRPRLELVAATEGNHGRAVARMARWLGLPAHIFLPGTAALRRVKLIESEGARVTVVEGTYDDAVSAVAKLDGDGRLVISDTAWEGYDQIPRWVMDGYSTLFREADDQIAAAGSPPADSVAVQMGVGALATSVVKHYRRPGASVHVVGVEPVHAACIFDSVTAGRIVEAPGPYDPLMAGLNCGFPSPVAWPVISKGLSACVALPTARALEAASALREAGVSSSPSGATGLGGFFELLLRPDNAAFRETFGWSESSTLLVLSTEGAE